MPQSIRSEENLNPVEKMISSSTKTEHKIPGMYNILTAVAEPKIPPFIRKWETELEIYLNKHQVN